MVSTFVLSLLLHYCIDMKQFSLVVRHVIGIVSQNV